MSSTSIRYGDNLNDPIIQAGWVIETDAFGLIQARVNYKWDASPSNIENFTSFFYLGAPCDIAGWTNLGMSKASMTREKGDILTIVAEFVGIDPTINEGLRTNPIMSMSAASSSEDITHHPNFYKICCTSITGSSSPQIPLAGPPPAAGGFEASLTANPNRALWTPRVQNTGATNNCQFVAFLPAQKSTEPVNIKAGVKSYYKPQNTIRMVRYFSTEIEALENASFVGWFTSGEYFGMPNEYIGLTGNPSAPITYSGALTYTSEYSSRISKSFLLTSYSVERFGNIWKTSGEFMLSGLTGWDPDIYPGPVESVS
jgi:hypothetical protein